MGAVTIHLPTEIEEKVRKASAAEGVSVSAWVAEAAKKQLDERLPPPEFVALFGTCPDFELPTRSEPWSKHELE
jgi:hypothetical protein